MLLLLPFMFGLLWFDHVRTGSAFVAGPWWVSLLLLGGGVVTVVPLVLFSGGARRLRLSTLAILQLHFALGPVVVGGVGFWRARSGRIG